MIEFGNFYQLIAKSPLSHWLDTLPAQIAAWQRDQQHGLLKQWSNAVEFLPELTPPRLDLLHGVPAESGARSAAGPDQRHRNAAAQPDAVAQRAVLAVRRGHQYRMALRLEVGSRAAAPFSDLTGRTILDVGCGSGYHLWRMIGAGAHLAVGIDPMQLFLCQFEAVRKLLGNDQRAHLLPLGIEQLPALKAFDTVFSMGVLYHRRSPLEHLWQLKDQLVGGGELVLETLVVEGDEHARFWCRAIATRRCATFTSFLPRWR